MKMLAIILLFLLVAVGCASSAPVKFAWINPLFNSQGPLTCAAAADTCKDLASTLLWIQAQGRVDSTLVATVNTVGRFGRDDSVTVDLAEGVWSVWTISKDSSGNASCKSNVVQRAIIVAPVAPVLKP